MISNTTIVFCVITLFVSLIVPIAGLIVFSVKRKGEGIASAWLLGAAGFFVPQMLIRIPLLQMLSASQGFLAFSQNHLFLYSFSLAFTAGLFELAGRFTVARLLAKKLTYRRALAAGLGHGGIEAIIIVGVTYINNLLLMVMLNTGTFDALGLQLAAVGQDPAQLEAIRLALVGTPSYTFLLAGVERLLTMAAQAGMTMLVCWGVHTGHPWKGALSCLAVHTVIDTAAGISLLATPAGGNRLSQGAAYAIIYAILTAVAVASVVLLRRIRRRWEKEEVTC